VRQQGRINEVTVEEVFDQQPGGAVVHGHRPEG
jgi:hypothetical protein